MRCAQCKQLRIQQAVECDNLIYKITRSPWQDYCSASLGCYISLHRGAFENAALNWKPSEAISLHNSTQQFGAAAPDMFKGRIVNKRWGGTHGEEVAKLLGVESELCLRTAWNCKGFYAELRTVGQLSLFAVTKTLLLFLLLPLWEGHFP